MHQERIEDMHCSLSVTTKFDGHQNKSKKQSLTSSKKNKVPGPGEGSEAQKSEDLSESGEKRPKRRKTSDSFKKIRKEDLSDTKLTNSNLPLSATTESESRQDQLESPIADDVFEGSNSSQESIEMLSMSSLLKSVLDRKKKLLLESDEIQQFFMDRVVKDEQWDGVNNVETIT